MSRKTSKKIIWIAARGLGGLPAQKHDSCRKRSRADRCIKADRCIVDLYRATHLAESKSWTYFFRSLCSAILMPVVDDEV